MSTVRCEGWVRKRGRVNTSFKQRWLVLADGRLDYFAKGVSGNYTLKGSIALGGAVVGVLLAAGVDVNWARTDMVVPRSTTLATAGTMRPCQSCWLRVRTRARQLSMV